MKLKEQYGRNGYIISNGVVDANIVEYAERHVRWTIEQHPGETYEEIHKRPLWLDDPFYLYLARMPGLIELAETLVGPDLSLFATGYIIKEPGNSAAVLWHQDGSYWPLEPMEVCTLWLAITESKVSNGCMRVIPRSHTMQLQDLKTREDVRNLLESGIDENLVDDSDAKDLILAPGDVSVHHPNIVHGSAANDSKDEWRLNLVIRVIAAETKVTDPEWPGVFHLSGRRIDGTNRYLPDPVWDRNRHIEFPGCESWRG